MRAAPSLSLLLVGLAGAAGLRHIASSVSRPGTACTPANTLATSVPSAELPTLSRRNALARVSTALLGTVLLSAGAASAADGGSASGPNTWISGKSDPLRKTSKDKPDGTKKDPKYLSCLNDCVPRCQGPPGANQKERSDCFEECQDECCFTYQQCTYKIRQ